MGLFTINFELGERTLETLSEIARTTVIRFELGPETRAMIERLAPSPDEGDRRSVGSSRRVRRHCVHSTSLFSTPM